MRHGLRDLPTPAWRSLLRPLTSARGYAALTHHLLGLPLGVAYFTWLVTGVATGLGLAITLIGIPILTLVFASVRPLLAVERALSNALLGTAIEPAPLSSGGEGWLGRAKAYWTDSATWRGSRTWWPASRWACSRSSWRSPPTRRP